MGSPLVRAAFALIVGATIVAFFVTQRLKGEFPLVLRFVASPGAISPNGDGVRDGSWVGFDLTRGAKVSFSIVDSEGRDVRLLVDNREIAGDTRNRFFWNGRDDHGRLVPDGNYAMRVVRRDEGRVITSIKKVRVDTSPPSVRLVSAHPGVISPGDPGQHPRVVIRYRGPRNRSPEFRIFRTDQGRPRVVARFRGGGHRAGVWRGTVRGREALDGDYAFTVTVRDAAGNRTVAPAPIPTARLARPGTGVAVRHLTLQGPLGIVRAGSLVTLEVGPHARAFRFALARLGARRAVKRGARRGGRFRVRVPARSSTGIYLVRVRADRRQAVWPLAVNARRAPPRRAPLVILPEITWQGMNRLDDDLDGFAATLDSARSVKLRRPFARGGPPGRLSSETAPLMAFLDRERLPYRLTTDVSLARGQPPSLGGAAGIAIAGSARWLPAALLQRLRRYVEGGGRLASFGADALRRSVVLGSTALRDPSAPGRQDALGERTSLVRISPAPLVVEEDRLGLFAGGVLGDFSLLERSTGLPRGARRLAAAGRDPTRPAFVAYRLGKGLVLRVGTPQWTASLAGIEVARTTKRIWVLLERG